MVTRGADTIQKEADQAMARIYALHAIQGRAAAAAALAAAAIPKAIPLPTGPPPAPIQQQQQQPPRKPSRPQRVGVQVPGVARLTNPVAAAGGQVAARQLLRTPRNPTPVRPMLMTPHNPVPAAPPLHLHQQLHFSPGFIPPLRLGSGCSSRGMSAWRIRQCQERQRRQQQRRRLRQQRRR
jgi:hypothetical protein